MRHFSPSSLLLLLCLIATPPVANSTFFLQYFCEDSVKAKAKSQVRKCLSDAIELKDECQRVNRVTLECVDFMKPCLHGGEMRRFNDSLLASVSNNWNQKLKASIISDCPALKEFQESGRSLFKATDLCDVQEMESANKMMDVCIRLETEELHQQRSKLKTTDEIPSLIRHFYLKVVNVCLHPFLPCFSGEEFDRVKLETMEIIDDKFEPNYSVIAELKSLLGLNSGSSLQNNIALTSVLSLFCCLFVQLK